MLTHTAQFLMFIAYNNEHISILIALFLSGFALRCLWKRVTATCDTSKKTWLLWKGRDVRNIVDACGFYWFTCVFYFVVSWCRNFRNWFSFVKVLDRIYYILYILGLPTLTLWWQNRTTTGRDVWNIDNALGFYLFTLVFILWFCGAEIFLIDFLLYRGS